MGSMKALLMVVTAAPLQAVDLKVSDVVVLIDREQGGESRLAADNLNLHAAFPLSFILEVQSITTSAAAVTALSDSRRQAGALLPGHMNLCCLCRIQAADPTALLIRAC